MTQVSGKKVVVVFAVIGVGTIIATMAIYFAYAPEREKSRNITFDAGPIFGPMPIDAAPPPPPDAAPAGERGMLLVPATTIVQGSTDPDVEDALATCGFETKDACKREMFEHEQPSRRVSVSPFWIDRTEVTTDALAHWLSTVHVTVDGHLARLADGAVVDLDPAFERKADAHGDGDGIVVRTKLAGFPAARVSWGAAAAYCHAQGKRLPREIEWETAARGGERRPYPWGGDRPRCDGVVVARGAGMLCEIAGKGTAVVGTAQQDETPEGVADLGGNVAEWVQDAFADYPPCDGCTDPVANHTSPIARVVRGGAWSSLAAASRAAGRTSRAEDVLDDGIGFRCAKDAAN